MPTLINTSGIVTRYINYNDNDRIITILTPEMGRIDAKVRGCRKPTSPLLSATQPFAFAEFELFQSGDKCTVNRCTVTESFFEITQDIDRYTYGMSVLRLAQEATMEREANVSLFFLVYHTLSFLAYGDNEPIDLYLLFLIRYLSCTGYCPIITSCAICTRDIRGDSSLFYSAKAGGTVCTVCARGGLPSISKISLEAMRRMLLLDLKDIGKVKLNTDMRREIKSYLFGLAEEHFDYAIRCLAYADANE